MSVIATSTEEGGAGAGAAVEESSDQRSAVPRDGGRDSSTTDLGGEKGRLVGTGASPFTGLKTGFCPGGAPSPMIASNRTSSNFRPSFWATRTSSKSVSSTFVRATLKTTYKSP